MEHERLIGDLEFLKRLDTIKVLIVDDQANMIRTLENMLGSICQLKRKRDSIFKARNGEEALRIILNQVDDLERHIDIVLLDWNMPKMPGIEVLRTIRNSEKPFIRDVPVIMITAESQSDDVENAVYEGANAYLLKPFLIPDLRERMTPLLRQHWSGIKLQRAVNRRKEVRYKLKDMVMTVRVELDGGDYKTASVMNISNSGLRITMDRKIQGNIKAIWFSKLKGEQNFLHKAPVVPYPDETTGNANEIMVGLWIKDGFPDPEMKKEWIEWVEEARAKELSYRANW